MYEHVTQLFKITFITQEKNVKKKKKIIRTAKKKKIFISEIHWSLLAHTDIISSNRIKFLKKKEKDIFCPFQRLNSLLRHPTIYKQNVSSYSNYSGTLPIFQ